MKRGSEEKKETYLIYEGATTRKKVKRGMVLTLILSPWKRETPLNFTGRNSNEPHLCRSQLENRPENGYDREN